MTIPRNGGEPKELRVLAPPSPMIVLGPMSWLEDDTFLFSIWKADSSGRQNGLWRTFPHGRLLNVLPGSDGDEVPVLQIADVSGNGARGSVMSMLRASQFWGRGRLSFLHD